MGKLAMAPSHFAPGLIGDQELNELTGKVIGCAYTIGNTLGYGFLEKVYENALMHQLRKIGLKAEQQVPVHIYFDGVLVGDYIVDVLVEQRVLVELKAVKALNDIHIAQCKNYLRATGLEVCLLINFAESSVEPKRIINRK